MCVQNWFSILFSFYSFNCASGMEHLDWLQRWKKEAKKNNTSVRTIIMNHFSVGILFFYSIFIVFYISVQFTVSIDDALLWQSLLPVYKLKVKYREMYMIPTSFHGSILLFISLFVQFFSHLTSWFFQQQKK